MRPNNYRRESCRLREWDRFRKLTRRDFDLVTLRSEAFR
jgi:hypothetical protein